MSNSGQSGWNLVKVAVSCVAIPCFVGSSQNCQSGGYRLFTLASLAKALSYLPLSPGLQPVSQAILNSSSWSGVTSKQSAIKDLCS